MRPRDLSPAFRFEERCVVLQDGILHLPRHYPHQTLPTVVDHFWDLRRPLCVEFCSGNGHWVVEQARLRPECNWIAVELQFSRVAKIWAKRANSQRNNLLIVCGEAQTFAHYFLAQESVSEVFIHFPDPWPKARHAKHRLIQAPFLADLARVLEPGGLFTFVTDDRRYAQQLQELIEEPLWLEQHRSDLVTYGNSTFASLWCRLGRTFNLLQYRNAHRGSLQQAG